MRFLSQSMQSEVECLVQFFNIQANQIAHLHILQVVPASFVPRVQIGSVARQGLDPHPAIRRSDEVLDFGPAMDRRSVPDHQQALAGHTQQVLQECNAVQAVQRPLPSKSVHLPARRHPAHDRQVVARLLVANNRRLTLGSIRPNDPRQKVKPRFVDKNQGPVLAPRPFLQLPPDLITPAFDRLLVTLNGPRDWHLRRPPQFLQQPTNMVLMVTNAKLFLDNPTDTGTGPNFTAEAVRLWPMPKKLRDQPLLNGRKLRWMPWHRVCQQHIGSTLAGTGQPTADRLLRDSQGRSDVALIPPLLFQVQRPQPPPFTPRTRRPYQ